MTANISNYNFSCRVVNLLDLSLDELNTTQCIVLELSNLMKITVYQKRVAFEISETHFSKTSVLHSTFAFISMPKSPSQRYILDRIKVHQENLYLGLHLIEMCFSQMFLSILFFILLFS